MVAETRALAVCLARGLGPFSLWEWLSIRCVRCWLGFLGDAHYWRLKRYAVH